MSRPMTWWVAATVLLILAIVPVANALNGATARSAAAAADAKSPVGNARSDGDHASRGEARADQPAAQAAPPAEPAGPAQPAQPQQPAAPAQPPKPRLVAGVSQAQMDNAAAIVETGKRAGLPKRAYVIAVATAMQESKLLNLANPTVPQSLRHRSQGVGYDHDSVGLFQQRPSAGWGTPAQLLDPQYAAAKFYAALARVPGWERMPLTLAAQTVQYSAFPYAYAKHEYNAQQIVDELTR